MNPIPAAAHAEILVMVHQQTKGTLVEITGIISALIIGLVIGALGRLVVPGRQNIGTLLTILVGIAAALLGTAGATVLGVADTEGVDWIELALQVGLAGAGVTALAGARSRQPR
jgi:uncharacterized membrane protein YeaQ/YmgE (transglycosylase-associated protein family)